MNIRRKILVFIGLLIIGFGIYAIDRIIKPFPFIEISYISDESKFNATPESLDVNISIPYVSKLKKNVSFLYSDINLTMQDGKKDINTIRKGVKLTRYIINKTNSSKDIRDNPEEVFDLENKYLHICSESSKIFVTIMQALGYHARVIWMDGHTTSEVFIGNKWILVDSYFNLMFKNKKGEYISLLESVKNFKENIPVRIIKPIYSNNLDFSINNDTINVYNNQKLFVVLDGKHLFNFHKNTKDILKIIKFIMGDNLIGRGIQFIGFGSSRVGNVGIFYIKNNFR